MAGEAMTGGIVQVHLTRTCNLRCSHCYSESGPHRRGALGLAPLTAFLARARGRGYTALSLSGGEPLIYPELVPLLAAAREGSWRTSAVTNGTLLTRRCLEPALAMLDFIGVSVDGAPERHNALRQSASAFERTLGGLERLRELERPFAIVHTLTQHSLVDLPWLLDFARELGARALRLHPLERSGFATALEPAQLTPRQCAEVYLWALEHNREPVALPVEVDLLNRERLRAEPASRWPGPGVDPTSHGDAVSPLVVEPDGVLVPFTYGMHRGLALGALDDPRVFAASPLGWLDRVKPLVTTAIELALQRPWPFFNWYEHLVETSFALFGAADRIPRTA